MKTATISLTAEQMTRLANILSDHAVDLCDNGNEDSEDAKLCYFAAKALRQAAK